MDLLGLRFLFFLAQDLEEKLARLVAEFDQAQEEKDEVMAEAERCQKKLDMAQRQLAAVSAADFFWGQFSRMRRRSRRVPV